MEGKTILVIGGAGFIGSNFVKYILEEGGKVYLWDNFSRKGTVQNISGLKKNHNLIKIIKSNYLNNQKLMKDIIEKCDCIFHLAAQVAVTSSLEDPMHDFKTNIFGTFKLLENIRKSKKKPIFIYASTNKVYGNLNYVDIEKNKKSEEYNYLNIDGIDENFNLDFYTPYGCSKGSADQYVLDYSRIFNLKTVVVRQSCIYGENQYGIEDQGWVACLAIQALLGKNINIYGDGLQVRDVLHVRDLYEFWKAAFFKINKSNGNAYNIGGGLKNKISINNYIKALKREVNTQIKIKYHDWRPGDQKIYVSDINKALKDLQWSPKIKFDDGLKRLLDWVRNNQATISSTLF